MEKAYEKLVDENDNEHQPEEDDCIKCTRASKSGCIGEYGKFVRLFEKGNDNKPWGELVVNCNNFVGKRK